MNQNSNLTNRDQDNMDAFIGYVLEDYKAGTITKSQAAGSLNHVMTALAEGNHGWDRFGCGQVMVVDTALGDWPGLWHVHRGGTHR